MNSLVGFTGGTVIKNLPVNAGDTRDMGSIPGSERSPGVGNGNPLQYSCLENPMDKGDWQATVHRVSESNVTKHARTHARAHTHPHTLIAKSPVVEWRRHWKPTPVLLPGKSHGRRSLVGCSP